MSNSEVTIKPFDTQSDLTAAAARELVKIVVEIQQGHRDGGVSGDGIARIVLTGGGAGIELCKQLATLDHAAKTQAEDFPIAASDWSQVKVFFGDERFVPADDAERNERQVREALLDHVAIPEENIFGYAAPTPGSDYDGPALDEAAESYAKVLTEHAPDGFDIHLLGMGPEGHINSLFPHTQELLHATGSVAAVRNCPKPPAERVNLTLPAINSAQQVWLLVAGAAKQEAAEQVARGGNGAQWPAALVAGREDTVLWVDAAARPE